MEMRLLCHKIQSAIGGFAAHRSSSVEVHCPKLQVGIDLGVEHTATNQRWGKAARGPFLSRYRAENCPCAAPRHKRQAKRLHRTLPGDERKPCIGSQRKIVKQYQKYRHWRW